MKKASKSTVIKQLKKTPIVQVSCKKVGISRATFYRWKKEDKKFANDAESAIEEGLGLINDMAESQLITAIKEGNLTGIIFWLKNHHRQYSPKLEVTTKDGDIPLTEEQKILIKKSLAMVYRDNKKEENNEQSNK
jgi:ACT domain-containing protein